MTVSEFYAYLCEKIPAELTLEGDKDGLSCCPDPQKEVRKVLICLDVTQAVIEEAVTDGCEVILAHHPMLHGGVESVDAAQYRGRKLISLIENGIAPERVIEEPKAVSTMENLRFSFEIIRSLGGEPNGNTAIISSGYHLYRAKTMAKMLGVEAAGVAGHLGYPVYTLSCFIREAFGVTHLWVFGN